MPAPDSHASSPSPRPHFFAQTPESLADLFAAWGLPRYRASQVMDWVYRKGVVDPREMTNLGASDRKQLRENLTFIEGAVVRHQQATDGTQKLLIDWGLGGKDQRAEEGPRPGSLALFPGPESPAPDPRFQTECVMIPSDQDGADRPRTPGNPPTLRPVRNSRRTACISSQMGCPVGCAFCASGIGGLDGNLTAGQIVQQVWQLSFQLGSGGQGPGIGEKDRTGVAEVAGVPGARPDHRSPLSNPQRITNVVFMGMGEPMANLRNVLPAIRTLAADWGVGLSARKITVSTVGVPAGIRKLADLDLPVTLAISLHAPNDEVRKRIIPWAEFVSIQQLVEAGRAYFDKTGREITLEYILLGGVNDQPEHARELVQVARRLRSNVNLIRYNEVKGMPFDRPHDHDVQQFQGILRKAGVNTHIRASRGRDIAAACGQLRHEASKA